MQVIYESQQQKQQLKQQHQQEQEQYQQETKFPIKSKQKPQIKLNKVKTFMPTSMSLAATSNKPKINSPKQHSKTNLNASNNLIVNYELNNKNNKPQVFYLPKMKNF